MVATKRIVCLANSRRLAGRCIAGREWGPAGAGDWIRPVSKREHGDVGEYERQYEDGTDPRVLDIIDVPVVRASPKDYQTENWLLDDGYFWEKTRQVFIARSEPPDRSCGTALGGRA